VATDEERLAAQAGGDGIPPGPRRARDNGHADPDGPASRSTLTADGPDTLYDLPKASVIVLRGSLRSQ
jgi:hypothetical protein